MLILFIDNISKWEFGSGNIFKDNSATKSGGAVYWNFNQLTNIDKLTYSNNTAVKYGNNYGSFAQALKTITQAEYEALSNTTRRRWVLNNSLFRILSTSAGSTSVNLDNQQSGGSIGTIYVALFDQFGQVVSTDSSSSATLSIVGNHSGDTYVPSLTGATKVTASNGAFKFIGITFTAKPGVSYSK